MHLLSVYMHLLIAYIYALVHLYSCNVYNNNHKYAWEGIVRERERREQQCRKTYIYVQLYATLRSEVWLLLTRVSTMNLLFYWVS